MSSGSVSPDPGVEASPQSVSRPTGSGEATASGSLPAPDEQPRAPSGDLATVRVREVKGDRSDKSYFSARAYEAGVEIGHVNATTKEAAIAGAVTIVEASWRSQEGQAHLEVEAGGR